MNAERVHFARKPPQLPPESLVEADRQMTVLVRPAGIVSACDWLWFGPR